MKVRGRLLDAGVAEQANHVAGLDGNAGCKPARDGGQMEVLREHGAAAMREANVVAAALLVGSALHAIDHAVVRSVDVLAPDLAADVDATVAIATFDRAIARSVGAEDAPIALRHAAERPRQRVDPGVVTQLVEPTGLGRRPHGPEPFALSQCARVPGGGARPGGDARAPQPLVRGQDGPDQTHADREPSGPAAPALGAGAHGFAHARTQAVVGAEDGDRRSRHVHETAPAQRSLALFA